MLIKLKSTDDNLLRKKDKLKIIKVIAYEIIKNPILIQYLSTGKLATDSIVLKYGNNPTNAKATYKLRRDTTALVLHRLIPNIDSATAPREPKSHPGPMFETLGRASKLTPIDLNISNSLSIPLEIVQAPITTVRWHTLSLSLICNLYLQTRQGYL